jgi:flagellar basal-body rod modification protein FlgD
MDMKRGRDIGGEMGAVTGIWNRAAAGAVPGVTAMDNSTESTGSGSSSGSATISANDFLSLLVTEMQNQDPTADTDPNEYINQLVNVNSLEQLIDINQTLSTSSGSSGSAAGMSGTNGRRAGSESIGPAGSAQPSEAATQNGTQSKLPASACRSILPNSVAPPASGNLTIPDTNPAAQRVARSLSGHYSGPSVAGARD